MILRTLFLFLLAASLNAQAATTTKTTAAKKNETLVPAAYDAEFLTDAQITDKLKSEFETEKKTRSPAAAGEPTGQEGSADYKTYRDRYLNLKTPAEVLALLNELEAKYPTFHDNDIKFFAARVIPMRSMAGFFWRVIPLVRPNRMSQEVASGLLRGVYEQMDIRFPGDESKAIFSFLTQPQPGYVKEFNKISDLQKFANEDFYRQLATSIKRLETINLNGVPLVMDSELRFGDEGVNATVSHKRYKWIGNAELAITIARLHRRAANILFFTAYNMNDFIAYRKDIGKRIGFDVATSTDSTLFPITGLDRKTRVNVLRGYPNLMTRIETPVAVAGSTQQIPFGVNQSRVAYKNLAASVTYIQNAWTAIQNENTGHPTYDVSFSVIDPQYLAGKTTDVNEAISNLRGMIPPDAVGANSAYEFHDNIAGTRVKVDLKSFYQNPPKDLKALLPTTFDPGIQGADGGGWKAVTVDHVSTKFRDYSKGSAAGWDRNAYAALFPAISNGNQVEDYERALLRTCGGRFVASGLFGFIK